LADTPASHLLPLARRLRAIRLRDGRSAKDLADDLTWPASKVSRIETGRQTPRANDIRQWAAELQATPDVTDELLDLLEASTQPPDAAIEIPVPLGTLTSQTGTITLADGRQVRFDLYMVTVTEPRENEPR
jgi:transcriptional regulator with XRE-family HTH domain